MLGHFVKYGAAALVAALFAAAPASATTITFEFKDGATSLATGSFDYSSANPILGFDDLDSFSLTIGATNFNTAYVQNASLARYMKFDTTTNTFIDEIQPSGPPLFGLATLLVATDFGTGFLFIKDSSNSEQYLTYNGGGPGNSHVPWTTLCINGVCGGSPTPVPEPATLFLLGAGLLGAGLMRRRKKA